MPCNASSSNTTQSPKKFSNRFSSTSGKAERMQCFVFGSARQKSRFHELESFGAEFFGKLFPAKPFRQAGEFPGIQRFVPCDCQVRAELLFGQAKGFPDLPGNGLHFFQAPHNADPKDT